MKYLYAILVLSLLLNLYLFTFYQGYISCRQVVIERNRTIINLESNLRQPPVPQYDNFNSWK